MSLQFDLFESAARRARSRRRMIYALSWLLHAALYLGTCALIARIAFLFFLR